MTEEQRAEINRTLAAYRRSQRKNPDHWRGGVEGAYLRDVRLLLAALESESRPLSTLPPAAVEHLRSVANGTVLARSTHRYADHDGTSDCANKCGCWMGPSRSGGPDGVDPFGPCPKATE